MIASSSFAIPVLQERVRLAKVEPTTNLAIVSFMSDLRFNPITGFWVSIAQNRNDRPVEFVPSERVIKRLLCPFCAGNELETPSALASYDANGNITDDPDVWSVRVVPNKYPSFSIANSAEFGNGFQEPNASPAPGPYGRLDSAGFQELIIPTSRHIVSLGQLTENESKLSVRVYRDRIQSLKETGLVEHAMLFTNCRSSAGASLEHIHTQLIAPPIVSDAVRGRMQRNWQYRNEHGGNLIHAIIDWELQQAVRVIEQSEHFSVVCPFASRFAFQVWIVPNESVPEFLACSSPVLDELAVLMRKQIRRLETVLDAPAYNTLFHLPPFQESETNPWFVEIFPRTTTSAGFELGTDIWINPVPPETASRTLKQV